MCALRDLVERVCVTLTGVSDTSHNIVRVHSRKLEVLGDLSFPADKQSWCRLVSGSSAEASDSIFGYLVSKDEFEKESRGWPLKLESVTLKEGNVVVRLNRKNAFKVVVGKVLDSKSEFGSEDVGRSKTVHVSQHTYSPNMNLTDLKVYLAETVTKNLLSFTNHKVTDRFTSNLGLTLEFSCSSANRTNNRKIICGPVLNDNHVKDLCTTAEQLYERRTIDMRLMAEHKYGLRTTTLPGWKEFFRKLGEAAVTLQLLQNKLQHATVIKLNDPASSNIKGASFILYNCARLSGLLREFEKKVASDVYPPLPELDDVDFDLLQEPEEWELLFVYVLRFPQVVGSCVCNVGEQQISPHHLILHLSGLASAFSVYYRRVRILTEPREHLFGVLHQRIYLLRALQCVYHNSLRLLNMEPVKQM